MKPEPRAEWNSRAGQDSRLEKFIATRIPLALLRRDKKASLLGFRELSRTVSKRVQPRNEAPVIEQPISAEAYPT